MTTPSDMRPSADALQKEREKWDAFYTVEPAGVEDAPTRAFNDHLAGQIALLLPAGASILEAGCGGGLQSLGLARLGRYNIHMMDFSSVALRVATETFRRENLDCSVIQEDVFDAGEARYDLVFNAGVLEHYTFEEQVAFVRGMASRSKQYVLAIVPNNRCYWYWIWRLRAAGSGRWPFGKEVPFSDLSRVFQAAGLTFLGDAFIDEIWTQERIKDLPDLGSALRDEILELHRSSVLLAEHKSYLYAALGAVKPALPIPQDSMFASHRKRRSSTDPQQQAVVADLLALQIGSLARERELAAEMADRLARTEREWVQRQEALRAELTDRLTRAQQDWAQQQQTFQAERKHEVELLKAEGNREVEALRAERNREVEVLKAEWNREAELLKAEKRQHEELLKAEREQHEELLKVEEKQHEELLKAEIAMRDERLASLRSTLEASLAEREQQVLVATQERDRLRQDLDRIQEEAYHLYVQLQGIYNSTGWAILRALYRVRYALFPSGSRRERLGRAAMHGVRRARYHFRQAASKIARSLPRRPSPESHTPLPDAGPVKSGQAVEALVSVVLPVYNHAAILRQAIESVLAQTYSNFELLLLNDGSTDDTEQVLAQYARHPRCRVLTQSNQTLPKALSNAFEFAQGKYWTWTSADNLMHPRMLEQLVQYLETHPDTDMVYADYAVIDADGQPLNDPTFRAHNRPSPDDPRIHLPPSTRDLNTVDDNFIGACFLYRSDVGRLLGEYDPNIGIEDYDYWMRVNSLFRIDHLDSEEALYYYRVHDNSLSARAAEIKIAQKVQRLMAYEADRSRYYRTPWTIAADDNIRQLLRNVDPAPHTLVSWNEATTSAPQGTKTLAILSAEVLGGLAPGQRVADCLAAWFGPTPEAPYDLRHCVGRYPDVCFGSDDQTVQRLSLFHDDVVVASSGERLLRYATAFADNRTFYRSTREQTLRLRKAPELLRTRPLRILLEVTSFARGGMEGVIVDMAGCLRQQGHSVSLLVLDHPAMAAPQVDGQIPVLSLDQDDRRAAYRQLLREHRIDLVNAHHSTFGAAIAAAAGIPFVQTIHGTYVWLPQEGLEAYRSSDQYTSAYACVSANAARYADIRMKLDVRKMVLLPNGIDTGKIARHGQDASRDRLRQELGVASDDYVFLNVASIYPPKAQGRIVRAMKQVIGEHPNARLVFVGGQFDQDYAKRVRQMVQELSLEDRVVFAGWRQDADAFYHMADAFVLPSLCEGWSLALAEALCAGLPVVATDVGAAREQCDGMPAEIIPPPYRSITDLNVVSVNDYLTENDDTFQGNLTSALLRTAGRQRCPEAAGTACERFDLQRAFGGYDRLFGWLIQGGAPAAIRRWLRAKSCDARGDDGTRCLKVGPH